MTALISQLIEKTEYKNLSSCVFRLFYATARGKRNSTALFRASFPISVTTHIFYQIQYSQTPERLFKHNKNVKSTNVVVEALDNISQYNILLYCTETLQYYVNDCHFQYAT